ncbi:MAG TPA: hypothetical protein VKE69_12225, partial [Planctomycetota bacterium]|nr:hypothetical protein [Planctomycetota bacterium]
VLREYELERRRANSRSVGISRTASRALSLPATLAGGAFSVARFLMRRGAVVERVVRYASRSFVE